MRTTKILQVFAKRRQPKSPRVKDGSWQSVKLLLTSRNHNISDLFLHSASIAIANERVPPYLRDLQALFEANTTNFESCMHFHFNLWQLETNAASHIRKMRRLGSFYNNPEFTTFLDMEKGISQLRRKVYQRMIELGTEEYKASKSKSEMLDLLNEKIKISRADLNLINKMELQAEIYALRMALHPEFAAVAVLNRGLIAIKIIEILHRLGYEVILVTHERERFSLAAMLADHIRFISDQNNVEESMAALQTLQAEFPIGFGIGVHPGYGYLAENARLPIACEENKFVFIGPPALAMHKLGDKSMARLLANQLNVALVPGYDGENQDRDFLSDQCKKTGFPVMIKSTDGGGGYGNRVAQNESEAISILTHSLKGNVILEKYLIRPKHFEIQLIIDHPRIKNGEVVYVGSRDCTLQKDFAKFIEIAPAETDQHEEMVEDALKIGKEAQGLGYFGPITVEFLQEKAIIHIHESNIHLNINYHPEYNLSDIIGSFKRYFNENNTRLQVEHAPSEHIIDLSFSIIESQLWIASVKSIKDYLLHKFPSNPMYPTLSAQEIINDLRTHSKIKVSVEVRVNAEEYIVQNNTVIKGPAKGRVIAYHIPDTTGRGAIYSGIALNTYVDTTHVNSNIMLICGFGSDREEAFNNVKQLLSETLIEGIHTNKEYLNFSIAYLQHQAGRSDTETSIETSKEIDKQFAAKLAFDNANEARRYQNRM